MINSLTTTLIRLAHNKALLVVALSICCLPSAAYAKAHCFCKLGPPSAPIKDFGEIDTYKTQIGHDSECRNLCNTKVDSHLSDAANLASACSSANGVSIVAYSAVGTKAYQAGKTYTCAQISTGPTAGRIVFGLFTGTTSRSLKVNNVYVNLMSTPQTFVQVPLQTPFTTFQLDDILKWHGQAWTYDATLYRDGVLVEKFSKKSPALFAGTVLVEFTGQPNNSVHGHTWKVEWHYSGNQFTNGSVSFFIP